jgi:hypothetical protein
MLSVGTVVMGASDVRRAAVFWSRALGYVRRDGVVDDDWVVLLPAPGGHDTRLALGLSETPVQEHPRVHLDLYAGTPMTRPPRSSGSTWRPPEPPTCAATCPLTAG